MDEVRYVIKVRQAMTMIFALFRNELQNHRKIQFYRDNTPLILTAKTEGYLFDIIEYEQMRPSDLLENSIVIKNKMVKTQYLPRTDGTVFMRVFNNYEDQS